MKYLSDTTRIGDFTYEVEYPQPEDFDEAVEFCGGEEGTKNFVCSGVKQNALQGPKDKVRKAINSGIVSTEFPKSIEGAITA